MKREVRWAPAAWAVLALAPLAVGADKPKPFVPANYPLNTAPVNWPTNPGTRYTMPKMVQRCGAENMAIKVSVAGWTEALYRQDEMGTYRVGDRPAFSVVFGDRNSREFGSVKDGRDGGTFRCTLYWMDEKGEKVLRTDLDSVRPACATCGVFHVINDGSWDDSSDFEDPAMRPRLILGFTAGIASAGATCTTQACPLPME